MTSHMSAISMSVRPLAMSVVGFLSQGLGRFTATGSATDRQAERTPAPTHAQDSAGYRLLRTVQGALCSLEPGAPQRCVAGLGR
jgi:hypothetical protein